MANTDRNVRRRALVTGCSSGIGKATALALVDAGYLVHAGVRSERDAAALRSERPAGLEPLILDVATPTSVADAVRRLGEEAGAAGLDVLVNNAGFGLAGPLELQRMEDIRGQFEVNTFGTLALTKACIPLLRAARGRIVCVSSVSGFSSMPFQGAYCASKFALEAFMDALRVELRPWGIAVSLVQPGDIRTPAWGKAVEAADAMVAGWSEAERALYAGAAAKVREMASSPRGIAPERVAARIVRVLAARRPPARALVGPDAPGYALLEALPFRLRDALVARALGMR